MDPSHHHTGGSTTDKTAQMGGLFGALGPVNLRARSLSHEIEDAMDEMRSEQKERI